MFTGLVEQVAPVLSTEDGQGQRRIRVRTSYADLQASESIAVNGVCLTVADRTPGGDAAFFVSEESLGRSNLGALAAGSAVNLERAVALGTRMGGHWVQGHVDALATVTGVAEGHDHHRLSLRLDARHGRYCVEKGSIAVNGVSLTINALQDGESGPDGVAVHLLLIPHTWNHTNLAQLQPGAQVNIEVDILAKYIERLCLPLTTPVVR